MVWFRRDLRLADNPALLHALAECENVVPVYVHEPANGCWAHGAASRWWLHHSLLALAAQLTARGSRLIVRCGTAAQALRNLAAETGATLIAWNRLYEPDNASRGVAVAAALEEAEIACSSHHDALLFEPTSIWNAQHLPYRVFTPFWRTAARELPTMSPPSEAPRHLGTPPPASLASVPIEDLGLLPQVRWDHGLASTWEPGEAGAQRRLATFTAAELTDYPAARDRPARPGTSRLSPHLHFGEIGPRQIVAALRAAQADGHPSTDVFLRQLGWREFGHHLLAHFPATADRSLDTRYDALPWPTDDIALRAWQRGQTGYPLVDAGMRELWHTGWMHNRVRMIVASFLTKNLQIHWREGARWFWDTLVDADLANNTLGWQWTAGCGADAAPYYRIFNPILQTERFDPDRAYLRRWLPELARLPNQWIHRPWAAPPAVLQHASVELGDTYPLPIVDLGASRERALQSYSRLKSVERRGT